MKNVQLMAHTAIVLTALLFSSLTMAAENQFRFSVTLQSKNCLVGDGCLVAFKLENTSAEPESLYYPKVEYGTLQLELEEQSGKKVPLSDTNRFFCGGFDAKSTLDPQTSFIRVESIEYLFGTPNWFDKPAFRHPVAYLLPPGKYTLRAAVLVWADQKLTADPVTFEVAEPTGAEAEVFSHLKNGMRGSWMSRLGHVTACTEYLEIIQKHKTSHYRPAALDKLIYEFRFGDDTLKAREFAKLLLREYPTSLESVVSLGTAVGYGEESLSRLNNLVKTKDATLLFDIAKYHIQSLKHKPRKAGPPYL